MMLNASKCSIISFSRKHSDLNFDYKIGNVILKRETVIKDLGVLLDHKLSFKQHIAYTCSKASKTLGFIFRIAKDFKNIQCLKALYCSLVRSILEYESVIWAPFHQNSNLRIESVQRRFVRFALRHLPWNDPSNLPRYEDRCKLIGLELLSVRRKIKKSLFVSDLLQSRIDCPHLLSSLKFNVPSRSLRSHSFLHIQTARTNYGHYEPISSMCRVFNTCSHTFDFHISRSILRKRFSSILSAQEFD